MRVLIVEDEDKISDAIAHILGQNKMQADIARDGDEGLILAEKDIYDVIVLDIMLPGKSGLEVLRMIRSSGIYTPVLLLTALDSIEDRVKGLDAGADDYLPKPFAMAELMARIRALYRRSPITSSQEMPLGNMVLNIDHLILRIDGDEIRLTFKEAQMLELLFRNPGMVFSKEQIIDRIWGYENLVQDNNVEIYVHYLRRKMKNASYGIKTIRGIGYTLEEK